MDNGNGRIPEGRPVYEEKPVYEERPAAAKKPRKGMWKTGLFLLILGALITGAGIAMGGTGSLTFDERGFHVNNPRQGAGDYYVLEENLPAFEDVEVESSSAGIEFIASDHYGLEMNLPGNENVEWEVDGDKLTVKRENGEFSIQLMNLGFAFDEYYIKVFYPEGAEFDSVKLDTSSGGIDADLNNVDDADIHALSGSVNLNVEDCGFLKVDSASGSVEINGAGDDYMEGDIHALSGAIDIIGGRWEDLKVDASSGSIEAYAAFEGLTDIHATSGSITVKAEVEGDYGYDIKSTTSSVTVNGENLGAIARHNTEENTLFKLRANSSSIELDVNEE